MGNSDSSINIDRIQEQLLENPLQASVIIEAIESDRSPQGEGADSADKCPEGEDGGGGGGVVSSEQFLKLTIPVPDRDDFVSEPQAPEKTHLILVADKSGSMAGNPWNQVKQAMKDIVGSSISNPDIQTSIIVYSNKAEEVAMTPSNYAAQIDKLVASNLTDFNAAFNKINEILSRAARDTTKTVIMFMTDGEDTVNGNNLPGYTASWTDKIKKAAKPTIIHTVGFSKSHDFEFLKNLSLAGTHEGMFRYCEPGDGPDVLKRKLEELFEFVVFSSGQYLDIEVTINGENKILGLGDLLQSTTIQGEVTEEMSTSEAAMKEVKVCKAETWIYVDSPLDLPTLTLLVKKKMKVDGTDHTFAVPCEVVKVQRQMLENSEDKALWNMRILSRNTDILTTKFAEVVSAKGDVSKLEKRLNRLQTRVSNSQVYGKGITKEVREAILEHIKGIQKKIDEMHEMMARYLRGETQSVSMLARAHDMRYEAQFSKSRRQRVMNKRVAKNMYHVKAAQYQLTQLQINKQEVEHISQDALDFYFCTLSQNTIKDILLDDDTSDILGFGLAVKRPEVALDEPTSIRLWVISGTLVSRTSMLDALQYKIKVDGHLSAHGGFTFDNESPLGVTTVGMSREPINAWLPLYINKSHWDRVKALLKPSLGYFCTLDPLGYDYKQMDVMFMVLGNMIGQLSTDNVGEHQLRLLFSFHRTCAACVEEFALTDAITELVRNFVKGPAGRTRDVIPNLYTLVGYIVSLPHSVTAKIFDDEGSSDAKLPGLWLAFTAECMRRAANVVYRETTTATTNRLLDMILHGVGDGIEVAGPKKDDVVVTGDDIEAQLVALCRDNVNKDITIWAEPFDPAMGVTGPTVVKSHSAKVDKMMDIWAQDKCGLIKNKNQAQNVAEARKAVKAWVKEGLVMAGVTDPDSVMKAMSKVKAAECGTDTAAGSSTAGAATAGPSTPQAAAAEPTDDNWTCSEFDMNHITVSMLETMAKLHVKLHGAAYPHLRSIPGCIAFIDFWLSKKHDFTDMDVTNDGLAPDTWISEVKEAVMSVFSCMNDYAEKPKKKLEEDSWVVVATDEDVQQMEIPPDMGTPETASTAVTTVTTVTMATTESSQITETSDSQPAESPEIVVVMASDVAQIPADPEIVSPDLEEIVVVTATDVIENVAESCISTAVPKANAKDSDDDVSDDSDDDAGNEAGAGAGSKTRKRVVVRVTLPMLLRLISKDVDVVTWMRAVMCQALEYRINSHARTGITAGEFIDLGASGGTESAGQAVRHFHEYLERLQVNAKQNMIESALWQRANHCLVNASTIWAFVGYLMNTHRERSGGFVELLVDLTTPEIASAAPLLAEKIQVLLTGRYKDCPVIASGNIWLPERKHGKKFILVLGEEVWASIEVELRSSVEIHVYRESDLPNRHGHCNSNPYIPNVLREKLGMALLPVKQQQPKRIKSKFTR